MDIKMQIDNHFTDYCKKKLVEIAEELDALVPIIGIEFDNLFASFVIAAAGISLDYSTDEKNSYQFLFDRMVEAIKFSLSDKGVIIK